MITMPAMKIISFIDPRLQILWAGYRTLPRGRWNHTRLNRPFWRLYWNATPGAIVSSGSSEVELKPQSYLLIAPNTTVSTANECDVDHLFIHFKTFLEYGDPSPRLLSLAANPLLDALRERVVSRLGGDTPTPLDLSLAIRPFVETCLSFINLKALPSSCGDPRIVAVLSYIENHLATPLSNAFLARRAGMSISSFNRHFKTEMGHTLHEYLQVRRVERACQFLQVSDLSIDEVAEMVGFCDRFYFSRVFKAWQGVTPACYKQTHYGIYK